MFRDELLALRLQSGAVGARRWLLGRDACCVLCLFGRSLPGGDRLHLLPETARVGMARPQDPLQGIHLACQLGQQIGVRRRREWGGAEI